MRTRIRFSLTHAVFRLPIIASLAVLAVSGRANAGFEAHFASHYPTDVDPIGIGLSVDGGASFLVAPALTGRTGYNWEQTTPGSVNWLPNQFTTFCIEILQNIYFGEKYSYNPVALQDAPRRTGASEAMDAVKSNLIRELWAQWSSDLTTATRAEAFQVAIWNIIYDTDFSVASGSGTFYLTTAKGHAAQTADVRTQANLYLDYLAVHDPTGSGSLSMANLVALSNLGAQDQVTLLNPGYLPPSSGGGEPQFVPAPAPPTAILALMGLLSCATLRWRRRHL
jgi:hypothetical protein